MLSHFLEGKWTMKNKLNVIFDVNIIESLKENEKSIEHDFQQKIFPKGFSIFHCRAEFIAEWPACC